MPPWYLRLRNGERLFLLDDVFVGDLDLRLQGADADISCCDIAKQGREHIVVIGDRGEIGRVGGFNGRGETCPRNPIPN